MGEKAPQRRQDDGRLSLLPILTERKVGPSRFPCGWRQVANRSRLDTGSAGRLESRHRRDDFHLIIRITSAIANALPLRRQPGRKLQNVMAVTEAPSEFW